ncbi:MAG TPA: phosphate ABC transporter permease PstA [Acidimicrobiia bacterium]|nr:phosphate ABC transporter permease PstA [Acidimicrobiia bacterium]
MSTLTQPPKSDRPFAPGRGPRPAPGRSPRRRLATLEITASLVVAVGVATTANALGISGAIAIVAIGYAAFVAVVALIELTGTGARAGRVRARGRAARRTGEMHVDLTLEEHRPARVETRFAQPEAPALHTVPPPDDLPDVPIRRRKVGPDQVVEAGVAALAAAGVAEVVRVALHMQSLVGLTIWWYVAFIAIYFLLTRDHADAEAALDRIVTVLVWSVGILLIAVLAWLVTTVVTKGLPQLSWGFLTHDLAKTGPLDKGGGAVHAIIGTFEQVGIATLIVVPLGILTAVYLHEIRGRIAAPIRFIVDAMSGLPSIVAGLLIYTVWVSGHGFSGAAGSAALVVLMLPTMTRATEEILRTVPDTLREGALALGAPQWRLVQSVVLPTALAGIVTASLLAVARAIGETAPMLLTAFGADATNLNPMSGPQGDLPLFVYKLLFLPNKTQIDRAWTGALVLVLLVLILFVSARLVARRGLKRIGGTR